MNEINDTIYKKSLNIFIIQYDMFMATNPKWFTGAGLIRSFGDRYGAVSWTPVHQGFFTSWLAFLVTADSKFSVQNVFYYFHCVFLPEKFQVLFITKFMWRCCPLFFSCPLLKGFVLQLVSFSNLIVRFIFILVLWCMCSIIC
jgi:hypothetical protein